MLKLVLISIAAHIALLSLVWIGFPVPMSKDGVEFYYGGAFIPADELPVQSGSTTDQQPVKKAISVKTVQGSDFQPWINVRDLNKPKQ